MNKPETWIALGLTDTKLVLTNLKHNLKIVRNRKFPGTYFPAFGLNTERYNVYLRIQRQFRKIRTRKTPNTETFTQWKLLRRSPYYRQIKWKSREKRDMLPMEIAWIYIATQLILADLECSFPIIENHRINNILTRIMKLKSQ